MSKWESVFFQSGEVRLHAARHTGSGDRAIVVVPGITTPTGGSPWRPAGWPRSGPTSTCSTCGDEGCPSGSRMVPTGPATTPTMC
jgi:hypothetical protein